MVHYLLETSQACDEELTEDDTLTKDVTEVTCPKCQGHIDDEIDLIAWRSVN